jgi:hypothetical protein
MQASRLPSIAGCSIFALCEVLEFILGCFAAQALLGLSKRKVSPREPRCATVALIFVLASLAPSMAIVLFCVARYDSPFSRAMSAPLLVTLGETSYSIYLVRGRGDLGLSRNKLPGIPRAGTVPEPGLPRKREVPTRRACDGKTECDLEVSVDRFGDPANGYGKDFLVEYRCSGRPDTLSGYLQGEADGKHILLQCPAKGAQVIDNSIVRSTSARAVSQPD